MYGADVVDVRAEGGEIVQVVGPRHRTIGQALYSDRSQIPIRMLTRGDVVADLSLLRTRLQNAVRFRTSLDLDATAYRLVHAEADLLPSLVVDKYGDYLVAQALSQGMDRLLPSITEMLVELLSPKGILGRNDPKVRVLEGLEQTVELLYGEVPESIVVREGPVEYVVDLRKGQKTGLFLDQRENRSAAALYARGHLLDCFSYNGGFALRLAPGCQHVEAIDISSDAVVRIRANAERNGLSQVEAREANVFDELRRLERAGARYETIVLDPPAFAKNKASVPNALAGYKEINLRAMRLLVTRRIPHHLQLFLQRQRGNVRLGAARSVNRQPHAGDDRRKTDAGARSSGTRGRAGNALFEVLHFAQGGVTTDEGFTASQLL